MGNQVQRQKFTPGPWSFDSRKESLLGSNGKQVVVYNSGLSFALSNESEEARANSNLITAAPEMYGALKVLADAFSRANFDPKSGAHAEILAVIAKAEGRQAAFPEPIPAPTDGEAAQ